MRQSDTTIDQALAAVLRRVREERSQTQEDVAFAAGGTTGSISRIELAQMNPTWNMVRRISQALDMTIAELARAVEHEER